VEIVLLLAFAIVYALVCRWIAACANSKGYSYWAFALFSFFATPILGFALAALVPERREPHRAPLRNTPT
jgi:hypothetical protein